MEAAVTEREHFDVLIVGAGISGIGAACHLETSCPGRRYAILEGRDDIGGTWDLFRYPGIRSDSDMFTLGYSFRPWKEARAIADGPSILQYLRDTAREFGVDRHIRFRHRVRAASWSSEDSCWTLDVEVDGKPHAVRYTCSFLYLCSGYYDYDHGHAPSFPGSEEFRGRLVHPQHWPEDLDYAGKRVVVIGSGATAVTLVPAMAETAAHVTMLQRSPTYVASLPSEDPLAKLAHGILPERTAHHIVRWKNVLFMMFFYQLARRAPRVAKWLIRAGVIKNLPSGFDVDTHFKPRYEPWDQRLCVVPDSDLFKAIGAGRASVVTDHIDTFTRDGIRLKSGRELAADVVVSATGLKLLSCGGIRLTVDGAAVEPGKTFAYKGLMLGNVPNLAFCVGYTNASWTLRADLSSAFLCRLLNHMDRHGYRQCVPRCDEATLDERPFLGLMSGYVQRAVHLFPKQSSKAPWLLRQNYILDYLTMRFGAVDDGTMEFVTNTVAAAPARSARRAA
jgi:cation diffusion facilitator CzcD-associated flavoprotein CzcO